MTKVEMLEAEIEELSEVEFGELRDWLLEKDWEAWDRKIEADAGSGMIDKLFENTEADHRAGKSREL